MLKQYEKSIHVKHVTLKHGGRIGTSLQCCNYNGSSTFAGTLEPDTDDLMYFYLLSGFTSGLCSIRIRVAISQCIVIPRKNIFI